MGIILVSVRKKKGNIEEMLSDAEKHLKVTEHHVVTRRLLATPYQRVEVELKGLDGKPLPGGGGAEYLAPFACIESRVTPRYLVPDTCLLLYRVQRRWKGKWVTTRFLVAEVALDAAQGSDERNGEQLPPFSRDPQVLE